MAADKFLKLNTSTGSLEELALLDSSAGVGSAGKGVALDSTGKLAQNMMPTGVGPALSNIVASENLTAGDFVNVFSDAGTPKARKADATDGGKRAHGFIKASPTAGQSVDVYLDGTNDSLTSLTVGSRYFLSATTPGAATATPPAATGNLVQYLGTALATTKIAFRPTDGVVLA
ncbi:MAG: hypothetical protein HQL88_10770 [Magnetococcales bacterium]|nr:hypothetical protein [Magnetococcales bacterium]